jgi:hypothetical protein
MPAQVHAAASYMRRLPHPKAAANRRNHDAGVNSNKNMVSTLLFPSALACVLGLLALEAAQWPPAAIAPAADSLADCQTEPQELRFEMLAPNAEPELPAGRGLHGCPAVYRVANVRVK